MTEAEINKAIGKHRWVDDKCTRCNLQRRNLALSQNLLTPHFPGTFFHEYLINGEWVRKRPFCITIDKKSK